ncbi:MAG: 2-C-methyl-D-erythritol 4-phosphate cytidylyltransferase [Thermodesulfobacteriota bacterium]
MANIRASAVIAAAGQGKRFGDGLPKQFLPLRGKPVLAYSVETISKSDLIGEIIIVVPDEWARAVKTDIVDRFSIPKVTKIIPGGPERQDSVLNGFNSLSGAPDVVAVHDGARPLVSLELLEEVIRQASACGAALAALPSNDTIKKSSPDMYVDSTVPRESLWFAQTPQAFRYEVLKNALSKAADDGFTGTDEALLVERTGVRVKIVKGSPYNIKITTPEDLRLGELILNMREGGAE